MAYGALLWVMVANFIFQGSSALTVDSKGRIAVPARHREVLTAIAEGQLTITKSPEGCLLMFPRPAWESFREQMADWPMAATGWKRIYLGNAQDVSIDASGRVLIAPELRAAAQLLAPEDRDAMLMGMGSHFELWNVQRQAANEAATMKSELPPALSAISF